MSYKYSLNGKTAWVTNFGSNAFRGTSPLRTGFDTLFYFIP